MTPFGWKWLAAFLVACAAAVCYAWLAAQYDGIGSVHLFGK